MKCDFCDCDFPEDELETLREGRLCTSCETYIEETVKRVKIRCEFCNRIFSVREIRAKIDMHGDNDHLHVFNVCATCEERMAGEKLNSCKKCNS